MEAQPNLTKRKASLALLDHQEFLATNAGTDLWTLEPQQLQGLVKAFTEWEKVNFTQMVTGHNNGPLDYVNHKDSIAHLKDFLEVVLYVVSSELLEQVQQANQMRTRQPQWKWEHLPTSKDPNTGVKIFHYQGCKYEYDPERTKILEHDDVHQLIALTFCKVYLTRFLQLTYKAQRT